MHALSLTPPWGTLIALKLKRLETRGVRFPLKRLGQPLAIHQTKGRGHFASEAALWQHCLTEPFRSALFQAGYSQPEQLPRAAIVAVVVPVACFETTAHGLTAYGTTRSLPGERERSFGDYTPGRYAIELDQVQALATPVPCRGMQGYFPVPADVRQAILAQLEGVPV